MRKVLAALALAAALVLGPTTAFAADNDSGTIELGWVLPNGGTADNVTWPQPAYDAGKPVPCGTTLTIQWDTYPYTTAQDIARTEALRADGVLSQGEDYDWAISWRFTTVVGACPVKTQEPTPTPTPTPNKPEPSQVTHTERHMDCHLGVAIVISEVIFTDYTWDGTTWVQVVTSSNSHTSQTDPTAKEKSKCRPNSTPTPTHTSKPSVPPSPHHPSPTVAPRTHEPSPTSTTSTPPSTPLAETGSNGGQIAGLAGIISVTGALLLWAARRKRNEAA